MTRYAQIPPQSLAAMELFRGLPPSALESAAACARVRRLPKDMCIFNQGDDSVRAHAIIEGGVRIAQSGSDGAQVVIRFIGPAEMFGTVALFTDKRYPADAITLAETLEASWSEDELLGLDRVRELATQRAERRVTHAVLRLARQAGHSTVDGTAIEFPLRRKDLADIAGTTLHTASRILTGWEKAGLLTSHNQHQTNRNTSEILRIAEDAADY